MPDFNKTASAATQPELSGQNPLSPAVFKAYDDTQWNSLVDELNGEIVSLLEPHFRIVGQKNDREREYSQVMDTAIAQLNEDGEAMPLVTPAEGWYQDFLVHQYRLAFQYTRHAEEVDNYGFIQQGIDALQNGALRCMKYAYADVFNRAIAPSTGAQFLCRDGMYFIDEDRPNPIKGVKDWGNLETAAQFTEDALFQAKLNARNTKAHNGDHMPLMIQKILLPVSYEKQATKVLMTDKSVGDSLNDRNTANLWFNMGQVELHDDFTGNTVFYQCCGDNEPKNGLQARWAVKWGVEKFQPSDPDVMGRRIRARWGIGCDDSRCWRGGELSALS